MSEKQSEQFPIMNIIPYYFIGFNPKITEFEGNV